MSDWTYSSRVSPKDEPLVWLSGEVKTPPFSSAARVEAGYLLRLLQAGNILPMPHSRPMPSIGPRCHELRIQDQSKTWRIIYRIDSDAIVIAEVFAKTTQATPKARERRGITQTELARRMGSSQSRVAKMEAGDPGVSLDLLVQGLLAVGASRREIAAAIAPRSRAA